MIKVKKVFGTTAGTCTLLFGGVSIVAFFIATSLWNNLQLCLIVSSACFVFLTGIAWTLHFLTDRE